MEFGVLTNACVSSLFGSSRIWDAHTKMKILVVIIMMNGRVGPLAWCS